MIVTLKAIKIARHLSEETTAFTANVYIDGKKAGQVRNGGTGGPNEYYWEDRPAGLKFEAHAKTQFPDAYEPDDSLIGRLLDKHDEEQWFKRQRKRAVLWRIEGDAPDDFRTISLAATKKRPSPPARDEVVKYINEKYGEKIIEIH